jgi:uracil-DNA glycosylase
MSEKLDIEDIKDKIYKKLESSGWHRVLKGFIYSSDFDNIIISLAKQSRDGKRFTPTMKNWFKAFEECPYDQLKVVMVGQDPYSVINQADGMAFSLKNSDYIQPSLEYMFNAINKTVYNHQNQCNNKDLTRWANQGVLLLNTALTTNIGKTGQHFLIWKPFIAYLFDWLSWNCPGLVYIYIGKKANEWSDCVNDNNYKFYATDPTSAVYLKLPEWDSKNVFIETKNILMNNYNFDIVW